MSNLHQRTTPYSNFNFPNQDAGAFSLPDYGNNISSVQTPNFNYNMGNGSGLNIGGGIDPADYFPQHNMNIPKLGDAGPPNQPQSWWDRFMYGSSKTNPNGSVTNTTPGISAAADGLGAVSSLYFGLEGLDLAKDQFRFEKNAFNKNFAASRKSFNNTVDNNAARTANNTSNAVLGIADNASEAERDAAEKKYAAGISKNKRLKKGKA